MSAVPVPDGLSDAFCSAFAQVVEERFAAIPVTACLVWDIANTPDAALVHIAEGLGMTRVMSGAAIRSGLPNGSKMLSGRGYSSAVKRALESLGYSVVLVTDLDSPVCDGSLFASGEPNRCGGDAHWAVCRVEIAVPVINGVQSMLTPDQVHEVWNVVNYFGRRAVRYIVTVAEGLNGHVYRDDSLVGVPFFTVPHYFDETFDYTFE